MFCKAHGLTVRKKIEAFRNDVEFILNAETKQDIEEENRWQKIM